MLIEMLIENTSEAYLAACQIRGRLFAGAKMISADRCVCRFEFADGRRSMHWVGPDSQPPPPPPFSDSFIREIRFSEWEKPGLQINIGHGTFPIYSDGEASRQPAVKPEEELPDPDIELLAHRLLSRLSLL